jgi:hypothetical protein
MLSESTGNQTSRCASKRLTLEWPAPRHRAAQQRQVPGDYQVVQGQLPAVYSRFQQIVRLAQRVERSFELVRA